MAAHRVNDPGCKDYPLRTLSFRDSWASMPPRHDRPGANAVPDITVNVGHVNAISAARDGSKAALDTSAVQLRATMRRSASSRVDALAPAQVLLQTPSPPPTQPSCQGMAFNLRSTASSRQSPHRTTRLRRSCTRPRRSRTRAARRRAHQETLSALRAASVTLRCLQLPALPTLHAPTHPTLQKGAELYGIGDGSENIISFFPTLTHGAVPCPRRVRDV